MENTDKPAGSLPSLETLPNPNVPQSGQSLNPNAQPIGGGAPANHAVTPHGESLPEDSQEAIQARIAQSRLDSYCRRNPTVHLDRKSTRLNSSHSAKSRMPSSA